MGRVMTDVSEIRKQLLDDLLGPEHEPSGLARMSEINKGVRYHYLVMTEGRPPSDPRIRGHAARGVQLERDWIDAIEAKRKKQVKRQVEVASPMPKVMGNGKMDCLYDGHGKEIKTSSQSDAPYDDHIWQAHMYNLYSPDVKDMELVYIDPKDLSVATYRISSGDAQDEAIAQRLVTLEMALEYKKMPDLCTTLGGEKAGINNSPCVNFYGREVVRCPFYDRCFDELIDLNTSHEDKSMPEIEDKLVRLADISEEKKWAKDKTSELDAEAKAIKAEIRNPIVEAGGEVMGAGVRAKITTSERESLNYKKALKAGVIDMDVVGDYVKRSVVDTWTIKVEGE